jgi:hypothetical protein
MGFPLELKKENSTGVICHQITDEYYGVCVRTIFPNSETQTDIYISHRLLFSIKTLFNVLYHEVLHAFSLNHSNLPGLMNYSIKINWFGVKEDSDKLYPSFYDIKELPIA